MLSLRALESRAAREQARLLREMRSAVVKALADATGARSFQLGQVLAEIDRYVAVGKAGAQRAAASAATNAFGLGADAVDAALKAAGARVSIPDGLYGISSHLLSAVIDNTTDQTRAVWSELGRRLKTQVRQAALGVTDPFAAMVAVAKRITDPKTFGTAMTRAEAIIRTEVGRTFSVSQHRRNIESHERLKVVGMAVYKYWLYTRDTRTREDHIQAGKDYSVSKAIPYDEPFIVGGEELMFPLDPNGSAGQTINCFLPGTKIGGRVIAASKARYAGTAWRIETARGYSLTVTPNHPILTGRGWVAAKEIREGDHVLANIGDIGARPITVPRDVDNEHAEAAIDEVFKALAANGRIRLHVVSGLDFHGDADGMRDSEIDVVAVNGEVLRHIESGLAQRSQYVGLEQYSGIVWATLARDGVSLQLRDVGLAAATGGVSRGDLPASGGVIHPGPLQPLLLGVAASRDAALEENALDARSIDAAGGRKVAVALRDAQDRLAGLVAIDDVVGVRAEPYNGPVFDVQTTTGWVHSNGIIAHNCRCNAQSVVRKGIVEARPLLVA